MTYRTLLLCTFTSALAACGDGHTANPDAMPPVPDAMVVDADAVPDASCFADPHTHDEIINACTSNQAVDKTPVTPLRRPDGSLPPLP